MGLSTISRAKRDQTWREDVVTNGIGRVEGIAVDWIAGKEGCVELEIIVQGGRDASLLLQGHTVKRGTQRSHNSFCLFPFRKHLLDRPGF